MKSMRALLAAAAVLLAAAPAHAFDGVVASIKPIHSLVAGVMEGVGEPKLIVQGAGSPHTYALRPTDAEALQSAKLVFWVGPALEAFLEKPLGTLPSDAVVIELDKAPGMTLLPIREGGTFETDDDGDAEGPFNAHVWLDPENARAMVETIAAALEEADPADAERYRSNAAALEERLDELEGMITATVAPVTDRGFVVYHDAYQYFEKRFGLKAVGSITVSPETAPGAARIAEIRRKIGELAATCVFTEPEFEPAIVSVTIEGTAAHAGVLDPLGAALKDGSDLYFQLLDNLADSLRQCLSQAG